MGLSLSAPRRALEAALFVTVLVVGLAFPIVAQLEIEPVAATPLDRSFFAVEGTVSSVAGTPPAGQGALFTLLDGLIPVDATGARVETAAGAPASLLLGARVVARLAPPDGSGAPRLALDLQVLDETVATTLNGTVDAVDPVSRRLTVLGLGLDVTPATSLDGEASGSIDLAADEPVLAFVSSLGGRLTAEKIYRLGVVPAATRRLVGTVVSTGSASWTLHVDGKDVQVAITGDTRIVGDPKAGDLVEAIGEAGPDGAFTAFLIARLPAKLAHVRGSVVSITSTAWTIHAGGHDVAVAVDAKTKTFGSPKVGDDVEILGQVDASGAFTAFFIAKVPARPVELDGTVVSIGSASWIVHADGKDVTVAVDAKTKIVGTPAVGDEVVVVGQVDGSGAITALLIRKVSPRPVLLRGSVVATGSVSWTILSGGKDVVVAVNASTKIVGSPKVGDQVEVVASEGSSGALTALTITKVPPKMTSIKGTVASIGSATWIVHSGGKDVTVSVDSQTKILGSPKVGDDVEVVGTDDGSGVITALVITRIPPALTTFRGTVVSIGSASWVLGVGGVDTTVGVDAQTKVSGGPKVGDEVNVLARKLADGSLLALQIVKVASSVPSGVTFDGTLTAIRGADWTVATTRVIVTPFTQLTGSPKIGDHVKVTGMKLPDGSVMASAIARV